MEFNKKQVKSILKIVFISILFYFFVKEIGTIFGYFSVVWNVIAVFVIGGAMAFIINIPMSFIEKKLLSKSKKLKKAKRQLSVLITLATVVLIIYMVMFIVIPELVRTMQMLIAQLQEFYDKLPALLNNLVNSLPITEETAKNIQIEWSEISITMIKTLQGLATGIVSSSTAIIGGAVSTVTNFIMSFIFCLYILFAKEKLSVACKKVMYAVLKEKTSDNILAVLILTKRTFSNFFSGQCLEAVILGSLFVVSMTVFKMPYALLIGILVSVTALIPIVGAFIGCIVGVFLIMMVNPMQAVWFVVLFLVIQQIEGNLIYPKVVGNSVGLPAILVFMAVILGGNLFGIAGMLLFIPLTSVFYTIIKRIINDRLEKKSIAEEKVNTVSE